MNVRSADISSKKPGYRILIAGGGTGGHVYPAIAIANELKKSDVPCKILFVGTRNKLEWKAVPKAGYDIVNIWISGFHRRVTVQNVIFPVKLLVSLLQSIKIILSFKPDAVITCGGYVSGPAGWISAKLRKPLFLQEQNSYPGITTRLLAAHANTIFIAFQEAADHFPPQKVINAGNPVRTGLSSQDRKDALAFFGFSSQKPVLLIIGGSGGARSINRAMEEHVHLLHDELGLQIIWQCGKKYYKDLYRTLKIKTMPNLRLKAFINDMAKAYAAADLVISRAGALSCTELQITGKASILVPSPNVAADHQTKNARAMADNGAAVLLNDNELQTKLPKTVSDLILNPERRKQMESKAGAMARPDAAKKIADHIIAFLNDRN